VGAELFHAFGSADGQTAVTKQRVAFRNYVNRYKTGLWTNPGKIRLRD